jgi:outer membrane protein assembly factor BamD (BamD/ComL family)
MSREIRVSGERGKGRKGGIFPFLPFFLSPLIAIGATGCASNQPLPNIEIPELVGGFADIAPEQPRPRASGWRPRPANGYEVSIVFRYSNAESDFEALGAAIAQALETIENLERQADAALTQKILAFHTLGKLYLNRARLLYSDAPGYDWRPYIAANRAAADAYSQVNALATPIHRVDASALPLVQESLFTAGQIHYSLGMGIGLPEDLMAAISVMKRLANFIDNGVFPQSAGQENQLKTALMCQAAAYLELGRIQMSIDNNRSEAAIDFFAASAKAFADIVSRFPDDAETVRWQYQVGESYYAAGQYLEAIAAYEKVRKMHPRHELAAASLDKTAFCYALLAESEEEQSGAAKKWTTEMFETSEALVQEYPNSPYAAEALIRLGDRFYDEASSASIKLSERIRRYKIAAEKYEQAMRVPDVDEEVKKLAQEARARTEAILASHLYAQASQNLNQAKLTQGKTQKAVIQGVVAEFQQIIETYTHTKYAELAHAQIGRAYMFLGIRDDEYYADALEAFSKLISKYPDAPPVDAPLNDALAYARIQAAWIQSR